jgi:hypothetical protein
MHLVKKAVIPTVYLAICLLSAQPALSQTPYYAGKTITIIRD